VKTPAGPVFQLLFFTYLGRQLAVADDSFYIIGNAVDAAALSCLFGRGMAVVNERRYGTLGHVLLSPRSRTATFLGRALPYAGNGVIISVFTLTVGSLLLGLHVPVSAWAPLALVIAVSSLGTGFFGLLLGAFALRVRDVWLISNVSVALMILFTGANVPRSGLAPWMRVVGEGLPLTHGIEAARRLVAGSSLSDVSGLLATSPAAPPP
jgi:ABC-type multidrug transport system permease subunit